MTCLFECLNDGKCVYYMERYMCNCRTGYTGDACQVRYGKIEVVLTQSIIQMRAYDEELLFVFDKDWKTNFDEQQARIIHYQLGLFITSLIVLIFLIIGTIWIRRYDKKYIQLKKTKSTNSK